MEKELKAFSGELPFSISQNLYSELDPDKNCKNYPNEFFKTYGECDLDFIQQQLLKESDLIPFWATKNLSFATKMGYLHLIRSYG